MSSELFSTHAAHMQCVPGSSRVQKLPGLFGKKKKKRTLKCSFSSSDPCSDSCSRLTSLQKAPQLGNCRNVTPLTKFMVPVLHVKWISDKLEIVYRCDTVLIQCLAGLGRNSLWWVVIFLGGTLINPSSLSLHTGKVFEGGISPWLFKGNEGDSWVYSQHC